MSLITAIQDILSYQTVEEGRKVSNANDQALAALIGSRIPVFTDTISPAAVTWTVAHGLQTQNIIPIFKDTSGYSVHPARWRPTDDNTLVAEWTVAREGSIEVFAGGGGYVTPGIATVGDPTLGSWDDGAAEILSTTAIKDALYKLSVLIAAIHTAPALLSGVLVARHPSGLNYKSAYISAGVSQNLSVITAGTLFNRIILSQNTNFTIPVSPEDQFGKADEGTLELFQDSVLLDSLDLAGNFVELERDGAQNWPFTAAGIGAAGFLEVLSVAMHNSVRKWQKGNFRVVGGSWITAGEVDDILVRHTDDSGVQRDTNLLTVFYDDGTIPSVVSGPRGLSEGTLSSSKYLDGVRYFSTSDVLVLSAYIQNTFNRTYSSNAVQIDCPGVSSTTLAWNDSQASAVRSGSAYDDDFDDNSLDSSKWSVSSGTVLEQNQRLEFTEASVSASTDVVDLNGAFVRGTALQVQVTLGYIAAPGVGGYEAGIRLFAANGGSIELVYHHQNTPDQYQVSVYYTPAGGSRTLHASVGITFILTDTLVLKIEETGDDEYEFYFNKNGGGDTSVGVALTFSDWFPTATARLQLQLQATNDVEDIYADYSIYMDDFVVNNGNIEIIDSVPDLSDHFVVFDAELTIAEEVYDIDVRAEILPLSVRGTSSSALTASQNLMIHSLSDQSTDIEEFFTDNEYRLPSAAYDTPPGSSTGNWTDNTTLAANSALVFDSQLQYPAIDFTSGYFPTQTEDYSGRTGDAFYFRAFIPASPKNSGSVIISGVTAADFLAGDIEVSFKVPTLTGWLDLGTQFDETAFTGVDTDGILLDSTANTFNFTLGPFSTQTTSSPTSGMLIMRINIPEGSAVAVTGIEFSGWDS